MGKAIRDVYGETLAELGAENENIVVLDADLSGSTKSKVFGQKFPDRFFKMLFDQCNRGSPVESAFRRGGNDTVVGRLFKIIP